MSEEITKVAIIYGEHPVDGVNKNGKIDFMNCTLENDYFHNVLMLKYLKENYKDDKTLQGFNEYTTANAIALYLVKLGNIVFFNTTSYRKDMLQKYGSHGVMMMPNEINEAQKESLTQLKEKIKEYNELQIWYDITEDNQARMLVGDVDVIDEFINTKTR